MTDLPLSPSRQAGDIIFTSGQLAFANGRIVEGDIGTQTRQAIANLATVLAAHGLTLRDVARTAGERDKLQVKATENELARRTAE